MVVEKIIRENEMKIIDMIKETITTKIISGEVYGTKIYLDDENNIKKVDVPDSRWRSCYIEYELCYIPKGLNGFKYESVGLIRDVLSKEEFNKFVKDFADDEEISLEEAYNELENSNDWYLYSFFNNKKFKEIIELYVYKYLDKLSITINEFGKIDIHI